MPDFTILRGILLWGLPTVLTKPSSSTGQLQPCPRMSLGAATGLRPQAGQALSLLEESLLLPSSTSPGYCLLRVGKRPACTAG